jgi:hypothetical protein
VGPRRELRTCSGMFTIFAFLGYRAEAAAGKPVTGYVFSVFLVKKPVTRNRGEKAGRRELRCFYIRKVGPTRNPSHRTFQIISGPKILSSHRPVSAALLTVPAVVLHLNMGSRYRLVGLTGANPNRKCRTKPVFHSIKRNKGTYSALYEPISGPFPNPNPGIPIGSERRTKMHKGAQIADPGDTCPTRPRPSFASAPRPPFRTGNFPCLVLRSAFRTLLCLTSPFAISI